MSRDTKHNTHVLNTYNYRYLKVLNSFSNIKYRICYGNITYCTANRPNNGKMLCFSLVLQTRYNSIYLQKIKIVPFFLVSIFLNTLKLLYCSIKLLSDLFHTNTCNTATKLTYLLVRRRGKYVFHTLFRLIVKKERYL